jgi:hypothetical protein
MLFTVIRHARKVRPKAVGVKLEPVSPKADTPKRKLDAFMGSDAELGDEGSVDGSITKGPKGGKSKQVKASGTKTQLDAVVVATRKSTRLNAPPEKKARIAFGGTPELLKTLFQRLGAKFAALSKTCDDIVECLRK